LTDAGSNVKMSLLGATESDQDGPGGEEGVGESLYNRWQRESGRRE